MNNNNNNWSVYILRCNDDTLYTGITNNIEKRVELHISGKGAKYTRGRGPFIVEASFPGLTKSEALKLEYKIKQLNKNKKIEYLLSIIGLKD